MNRAIRIHTYGGAEVIQIDRTEQAVPGPRDVIVRVRAAGVNGLDWKIRDGILKDVFALPLPITLGIELAGEVAAIGSEVSKFAVGDRVMGALGAIGAYADHVVVAADKLTLTPADIDDVHAAAIPVAALTAWQALFEAGELKRGQTVLIHGAAGGVGSFAVQFARRIGAHVVATAQGVNAGYLRGLGAHQVIDYRTTAFWEQVRNVDLVLDLVGGPTLTNSWQVLGENGKIVSTAAPEILGQTPEGQRGVWFQMKTDSAKLAEIARMVAQGELKVEAKVL